MTLTEQILDMSARGVSMDIITMILRSDGTADSDIAAAYDEVAQTTTTRLERGIPYIEVR